MDREKAPFEFRGPLTVLLLSLALYAASAPRTIALEDDAIFILASYFLGTPQPPGYPLYVLLGKLSTLLPFGSVAFRVHLLSGLFGALTCALLWHIIRRLGCSRTAAFAASLAYAASDVFWSQAIIAEVYTLNTFLFFSTMALLLWAREAPSPGRPLGLAALVYGLALSNHWPLVGLSTPGLLAMATRIRAVVIRRLPLLVGLALVGLLPYLWMVIRTQQEPIISFLGPIDSWQDFWDFFSRKNAASLDANPGAGWGDRLAFFGFLAREAVAQYTWLGFALVVIGFVRQWKRLDRDLAVALVLAFLGSTVVLNLLLNFYYESWHQYLFRVYPMVSYGVMAIWLAMGIDAMAARIGDAAARLGRTGTAAAFSVLIIGATAAVAFPTNWRADYRWGDDYGRMLLSALEKDAILLAFGDVDLGTTAYLNLVEKVRPDVTIYHPWGQLLGNRLFSPTDTSNEEAKAALTDFMRETDRPVYLTGPMRLPFALDDFLLFYRARPDAPAEGSTLYLPKDLRGVRYIAFDQTETDRWTTTVRQLMVQKIARTLTIELELKPRPNRNPQLTGLLQEARRRFAGLLGSLDAYSEYGFPATDADPAALFRRAEERVGESPYRFQRALLLYFKADYRQRMGETGDAAELLEHSLATWPSPENPATRVLMDIYKKEGDIDAFRAVAEGVLGWEVEVASGAKGDQ